MASFWVTACSSPSSFNVASGTEEANEHCSKSSAQKAVEEEVSTGVDTQHGVAGGQKVLRQFCVGHFCYLRDVVDGGRQTTQEEADGNAENYQCQTVF